MLKTEGSNLTGLLTESTMKKISPSHYNNNSKLLIMLIIIHNNLINSFNKTFIRIKTIKIIPK